MAEPKMLLDKSFNDLEYARMAGTIKRVLEKWTLDAAFHDAYLQDPDRALAETGLDVDPETIRLLLTDDAAKEMTNALEKGELAWDDLPDGYRFYKAFVKEKIAMREGLRKEHCVPSEPRFQAWRERQEKRRMLELGAAALAMIQAPLMFELSEGCSVGSFGPVVVAFALEFECDSRDIELLILVELAEKGQEFRDCHVGHISAVHEVEVHLGFLYRLLGIRLEDERIRLLLDFRARGAS